MFLTWLTPVGLQRLSRHWDSYDRARRGGRDGERRHSGRACTPRRQAGGGGRGGGEKDNIAVPCVSFCHLLWLSLLFSPFFLHFVPHQRLPPWQTSSRGCFFDSQCHPPSTTVCVPLRSLYLRGRRHTQEGFSPVAWPLPSLKAKLAVRGALCIT